VNDQLRIAHGMAQVYCGLLFVYCLNFLQCTTIEMEQCLGKVLD